MKKSGKFWAAIICALALVSFAAYYIQYKTVKPILRGYIEPPVNRVFDQIAASEQKKHYAAYFPDRTFAYAYYYGIDKKKTRYGGTGVAPCYLTTGEYVVFKGKAWPVSGRSGEAVIQGVFIEKDNVIELKRVRWVRNEKAFAHWMEAECHYTAVDKRLRFKRLMKEAWPDPRNKPPKGPRRMGDPDIFFTPAERLDARAEDALGVPVERKQQLKIDTANGTWEIIGRKETFRPGKYYRLETETVEKGTLKKAVPVSSGGKKVQKVVNKEQP